MRFVHEYRVFEIEPTSRTQFEVTLISNPDSPGDRRRPDRVTTGPCMGNLRLVVDWQHIDRFAVGKNFTLMLEERGNAMTDDDSRLYLSRLMADVHIANAKWWVDLETGEPTERNVGELLCLIHSEISEAMEGHRKGLMDDKLPHRPMIEVELADAMIRILDAAAGLKLDLAGAYVEKMAFNATRADHKREARLAVGGKKY
jgi:hypothetical protein